MSTAIETVIRVRAKTTLAATMAPTTVLITRIANPVLVTDTITEHIPMRIFPALGAVPRLPPDANRILINVTFDGAVVSPLGAALAAPAAATNAVAFTGAIGVVCAEDAVEGGCASVAAVADWVAFAAPDVAGGPAPEFSTDTRTIFVYGVGDAGYAIFVAWSDAVITSVITHSAVLLTLNTMV